LITGGTSGIGLSIAERFLHEGAAVVVTGLDDAYAEGAAPRLALLGAGSFVPVDATDAESIAASVETAVQRLGTLAILVNNIGVGVLARVLDTPLADFDRIMNVNLRSYFLYAQACYPHLAATRGCMIHTASDAGIRGSQPLGVYSISKAAVIMLGKLLALDGAPDGVRSNCICPGDILPGMRHMGPPHNPTRGETPAEWDVPPLGRFGKGSDVAGAAVYLASDDASFVSGVALLVDGGMQAGRPGQRAGDPK
jgi:NAD(P)-dependent dehydrogenase (short-subunit alcohol dehydrogenase family)